MKISILQENFKKALQIVGRIAGKNINLPILNNILIEATDKKIELISTDLELGVVSKVRGKIEKKGRYTVDSKLISDYISLLPNKKIDIKLENKNFLIECDNYKTSIKGEDAEDFPLIPEVSEENYYEINISDFKKALSQTIFAVAGNETRIELSGVLFHFIGDKLILAATDSYRLAEKSIEIKNKNKQDKKVIIPAKTLQEVNRIITLIDNEEFTDSFIEVCLTDNQVLFILGDTKLVSKLIEGQYPDYEQIIPNKQETLITIEKNELVRAIKTSSIFSRAGVNDINLDFPVGKNKVIVSSTSSHSGDNIAELEAQVRGIDNSIVVNYKFLLEGINNIPGENILIDIVNGNTPCVLRPEKKEDKYLYIVMPIKQ